LHQNKFYQTENQHYSEVVADSGLMVQVVLEVRA